MPYSQIFGLGFGLVGGTIGVSWDIARRCAGLDDCELEAIAANATDASAIDSLKADLVEDLACSSADDDSIICAIASIYALFCAGAHFVNMIRYYPCGTTMLFAGTALGASIGASLDECTQPPVNRYRKR